MTTYAMAAVVQQTVYGSAGQEAASAAAQAVSDLNEWISWRSETSDIAQINNQAGSSPVQVQPSTLSILQTCLDVAQKSGGAFDPTVLPLTTLWNIGSDNQRVPSAEEISQGLACVGYQNLVLDPDASTAFLSVAGAGLDLGAVGKGAGCDAAVAAYQEAGVEGGVVAVGGSVGVYGSRSDGRPWTIAIRNPNSGEDRTAALGTLEITEGFVSTSGTYEQTFTENGVTYHHILDPKTGYPSSNDLVSVTVVCDNGALSDALSTACLVLGLEQAQTLLAQYDAGGIFINEENQIFVTDNLQDALEVTADGFTLMS